MNVGSVRNDAAVWNGDAGRGRSDTRRMAEEGEMNEEQFAFIQAINEYKRVNGKPFPTWTEVLDILLALGYRKVAEPKNITEI